MTDPHPAERRLLVIAHDHVSPAGEVERRFAERGFAVDHLLVVPEEHYFDPGVTCEFPDPEGYDALVVMGAPWSVYSPLVASWVGPELDLLRRADAADVPVLGICFGGQLLAKAHGGSVERSPQFEIGWQVVHSEDPDLVSPGPWFHWHFDRWQLPPGAEELARNAVCSQAFVLRRNLAVQFHPELDAAMLKGWLDTGGTSQATGLGLDCAAMLAQTVAWEADSAARARSLVDAFLDRVAYPTP